MRHARLIAALGLVAVGCASPEPTNEPDSWSALISGEWSLPAGVEGYRCVYATLDRDLTIGALRLAASEGTHHVTLGVVDEYDGPDGFVPCTAADIGDTLLFGAGLGTTPLELPEGTAIRLEAGTRLVVNLHLLNASADPLSGASGVEIREVAPATVEETVESVFAGPTTFEIPAYEIGSASGACTLQEAGSILGVMPHMHQLGRHLSAAIAHADGSETPLFDGPYDFESQVYEVFEEAVATAPGDRVVVTCTWDNSTPDAVSFGSSSYSEMCFLALLQTPATGRAAICDE